MKVRVASAGTGKTTGLVAWFLARIDEGVPLRRLAGVTFTRAAADELRTRVAEGVEAVLRDGRFLGDLFVPAAGFEQRFRRAADEVDGATLDTIHGFMASCLRLSAPWLGLDPSFVVIPPWEADAIFEEELRGWLDDARRDPTHPATGALALLGDDVEPWVEATFRHRSLAEQWRPADGDDRAAALVATYDAVYRRFVARLGAHTLAPSEIERRALAALRTPLAVERIVDRSPWIVVDEFQDVNPMQGRFFRALEEAGATIEVVGDPKQSIYGFRHADVGVFRDALARGRSLPPLTHTRRHARRIVRFLNHMTRTVAVRGGGFAVEEAPDVEATGEQATKEGRVEVHWVLHDGDLDASREHEVTVLLGLLESAHAQGTPWTEMAVLARAGARLRAVADACREHGIPTVVRRGGGYYERRELRDLVHALRVGIAPTRHALVPWLRGPFGGLAPASIAAIMATDDPVQALADAHADVFERLTATQEAVRRGPRVALRRLIEEPWIDGRRFVDRLDPIARENVDAFAFEVASFPPGDVRVWLARLDLLARRARDESGVPPDAHGVTLTTIHGSKGLEWPLVAWIDAGANVTRNDDPLLFEGDVVYVRGGPGADAAYRRARQAARHEMQRLAYVAASRPRDVAIVIGSARTAHADRARATVWTEMFEAMAVGPTRGTAVDTPAFVLARHEAPPKALPRALHGGRGEERTGVRVRATTHAAVTPAMAPWTTARAAPRTWSLVASPSSVAGAPGAPRTAPLAIERFASNDRHPEDEDGVTPLPGRGVVIGTLLHDAIRRDADPDDAAELATLSAQELMFPYSDAEREGVIAEVRAMLRTYRSLLGGALPALHDRERDLREWPILLPDGDVTWRGVVDRLYLVRGTWFLDDYKADRRLRVDRYVFQLACYAEAVRRVADVRPVVRLVGLREGNVVVIPERHLETAWHGRPPTRMRDTLGMA